MKKNKNNFTTIVFLAVAAFIFVGCNNNEEHNDMGQMVESKVEYKNQNYNSEEAKIGDFVLCPVMKTKFKVSEKSLFATIKDKKYYVCCPSCIGSLGSIPDKYLNH